jgi:hypothetical protein
MVSGSLHLPLDQVFDEVNYRAYLLFTLKLERDMERSKRCGEPFLETDVVRESRQW